MGLGVYPRPGAASGGRQNAHASQDTGLRPGQGSAPCAHSCPQGPRRVRGAGGARAGSLHSSYQSALMPPVTAAPDVPSLCQMRTVPEDARNAPSMRMPLTYSSLLHRGQSPTQRSWRGFGLSINKKCVGDVGCTLGCGDVSTTARSTRLHTNRRVRNHLAETDGETPNTSEAGLWGSLSGAAGVGWGPTVQTRVESQLGILLLTLLWLLPHGLSALAVTVQSFSKCLLGPCWEPGPAPRSAVHSHCVPAGCSLPDPSPSSAQLVLPILLKVARCLGLFYDLLHHRSSPPLAGVSFYPALLPLS